MSSGACDPALHQKLSVIVTVRNEKAGIRGFVDSDTQASANRILSAIQGSLVQHFCTAKIGDEH